MFGSVTRVEVVAQLEFYNYRARVGGTWTDEHGIANGNTPHKRVCLAASFE